VSLVGSRLPVTSHRRVRMIKTGMDGRYSVRPTRFSRISSTSAAGGRMGRRYPWPRTTPTLSNHRTNSSYPISQRFSVVRLILVPVNQRFCNVILPYPRTSSLTYTITKGLFESKPNPLYRKSEVGICSSIDSINVTIRRSTSASPWTRFFSDSKS
jgi:hypothetical protein